MLSIKDEDEFNRGLQEYGFAADDKDEYASSKLGVEFIKRNDKILIGNFNIKDKSFIHAVAAELFDRQEYMDEATIKKITSAPNHFSIFMQKNNFLQEDLIINGNFKNGEMLIAADIKPLPQFSFTEGTFDIYNKSLLNFAVTQPSLQVYQLMPEKIRSSVSTALNFNIDSLFVPQNDKYYLDIQGIKSRVDSAISYTYDDDFNKVEKVVVNNVQEPSFNFIVYKKDSSGLMGYWKRNKNIEGDSDLFVSVPFVKTYAVDKKNAVSLTSLNYTEEGSITKFNGIAYLDVNPGKIPSDLLKFFPDQVISAVEKFNSVKMFAIKHQDFVHLTVSLTSKISNKPFLLSIR